MLEYTVRPGTLGMSILRLGARIAARRGPGSARRALFVALSFAALVSVLNGCGGPFLLLPGGQLEGEVVEAPADWSFTDDVKTVQLESNPVEPYSVNIWATAAGESLYIHAGANRARWVEHLETDPRARVQIANSIYALRATRVSDATEFAAFANAYQAKYGSRPRNESIAEIYLYRMAPR